VQKDLIFERVCRYKSRVPWAFRIRANRSYLSVKSTFFCGLSKSDESISSFNWDAVRLERSFVRDKVRIAASMSVFFFVIIVVNILPSGRLDTAFPSHWFFVS